MFELLFSPSGRINRKVFLWGWFSLILVSILIETGITYFFGQHSKGYSFAILPTAYSITVLFIKRFHDLNKSGWFFLTLLIPIVSLYFYLILIFKKGATGDNNYGPDPLEKADVSANPASSSTVNQHSMGSQQDTISNSAHHDPVYITSSPGIGKNLIALLGVALIVAGIIGYMLNSDSHVEKNLSNKSSDTQRELSSSTIKNSESVENTPDQSPKFVFKVLNINHDEVTVQFERDIPMNIKFFGVSKDLVRRAEILSRQDHRQAVIFLNSASLLQIGKRYYGYLVSSEEPAAPSKDWL